MGEDDNMSLRIDLTEEPPTDAETAFSLTAFEHVFEMYEALLESGFGEVEALDYLAVSVAGREPHDWANTRGVQSETVIQHVEEVSQGVESLSVFGRNTPMTRNALKEGEYRGAE